MVYTPLRQETVKHQALKQRLLAKWPDCDEETLHDTLEGITDLHEMIAAVIRSALETKRSSQVSELALST